MVREHGAEIQAGQDIAVEHEKCAVDAIGNVAQGTRGTQWRCLDDVGHAYSEARAVPEVVYDRLLQVAGCQNDFRYPGIAQASDRAF